MRRTDRYRYPFMMTLLVVLQFTVRSHLGGDRIAPDFLLLALLLYTIRAEPGKSALAGFIIGLLRDAVTVVSFGAGMLAHTLVAFASSWAKAVFFAEHVFVKGCLFFAGTWLRNFLVLAISGKLQGSQVAVVSSLRASRTEVRPGESVTVTAVLDLYRGREWEESWVVTIPEDTTPGDAEIVVGSGPAIDGLDRRTIERQVAQAGGLGDLVRLASRQRRSRTLYLRMTRRAPTAIVRSEVLPDLPLSIFTVFNNPRLSADTTLMGEAPILELPKDLDVVVVGGRRISIRVK